MICTIYIYVYIYIWIFLYTKLFFGCEQKIHVQNNNSTSPDATFCFFGGDGTVCAGDGTVCAGDGTVCAGDGTLSCGFLIPQLPQFVNDVTKY